MAKPLPQRLYFLYVFGKHTPMSPLSLTSFPVLGVITLSIGWLPPSSYFWTLHSFNLFWKFWNFFD